MSNTTMKLPKKPQFSRRTNKLGVDQRYVRLPGDKRRPVIAPRPTLRVLSARLRVINRTVRAALKHQKPNQPEPAVVGFCRRRRAAIAKYLRSLTEPALAH